MDSMSGDSQKSLVFDVETTTGVDFDALRSTTWGTHPIRWTSRRCGPKIAQITWKVVPGETSIKNRFVLPERRDAEGMPVPLVVDNEWSPSVDRVTLDTHGLDVADVLRELVADARGCCRIVAHNIWFDRNVVCAELAAAGMVDDARFFQTVPGWCTMARSGWTGKFPRLQELGEAYDEVGDIDPRRLHDAAVDTELCARVFARQVRGDAPGEPPRLWMVAGTPWRRGLKRCPATGRLWTYDTPGNRREFYAVVAMAE